MGNAYSGSSGKATTDGTDQCVTGYSIDYTIEERDATTTCDDGWDYPVATTKRAEGTFDVLYDPAKPFLAPGTVVALVFDLPTTDQASGNGLITKASIKSAVKDLVTLQYSFKSQGAWTFPT